MPASPLLMDYDRFLNIFKKKIELREGGTQWESVCFACMRARVPSSALWGVAEKENEARSAAAHWC